MAIAAARTGDRAPRRGFHPLHLVLLAGTIPLALGTLLSDLAYWFSYHIQWNNFASWLIVGALVFGAGALMGAIVALVRPGGRTLRTLAYALLVLAMWILGFINALVHARDAWASMPAGLVLSALVALLACAATWVAFSTIRQRDMRPGGGP